MKSKYGCIDRVGGVDRYVSYECETEIFDLWSKERNKCQMKESNYKNFAFWYEMFVYKYPETEKTPYGKSDERSWYINHIQKFYLNTNLNWK